MSDVRELLTHLLDDESAAARLIDQLAARDLEVLPRRPDAAMISAGLAVLDGAAKATRGVQLVQDAPRLVMSAMWEAMADAGHQAAAAKAAQETADQARAEAVSERVRDLTGELTAVGLTVHLAARVAGEDTYAVIGPGGRFWWVPTRGAGAWGRHGSQERGGGTGSLIRAATRVPGAPAASPAVSAGAAAPTGPELTGGTKNPL
ncbi:MAG: hypothetical protein IT481_08460 [Gammaproteobacteria bacterium]|nr:hypothetical protein [Gammaproteobacteria bacterium]